MNYNVFDFSGNCEKNQKNVNFLPEMCLKSAFFGKIATPKKPKILGRTTPNYVGLEEAKKKVVPNSWSQRLHPKNRVC